jgi:hypothetical protein
VEPTSTGSRLHVRLRAELPFVLPRLVTEHQFEQGLSRDLDATLFRLKEILEGVGASAGDDEDVPSDDGLSLEPLPALQAAWTPRGEKTARDPRPFGPLGRAPAPARSES